MSDTQKNQNLYDSHVHWQATGEFANRLSLAHIKTPEDLKHLTILPHHFRSDKNSHWLLGYGWDQNRWDKTPANNWKLNLQGFATKEILDKLWPNEHVVFTRVDGHAMWLNSQALNVCGLAEKYPDGVLVDNDMDIVQKHIPAISPNERANYLLEAQSIFHRNGFTHIRDLSFDYDTFLVANQMASEQLLQLAVEGFVPAMNSREVQNIFAVLAEMQDNAHPFLRVRGIKTYFDGALGSEGALVSQPYLSGSGQGLQLLELEELEQMLRLCWQKHLTIAIHVIGDEAAHKVASLVDKLYRQNIRGNFELEHVELLRPETIELLADKSVTCHMQPCHWLSDSLWLEKKIGKLCDYQFQWAALEANNVQLQFGSDAPIEPVSLSQNLLALKKSQVAGVAPLKNSWQKYHSHPDRMWVPNCYTEIWHSEITDDLKILKTFFAGKLVYSCDS